MSKDNKTTERWVVAPENCYQMERKYGWELIDIQQPPTPPNDLLKTKCVFEGDAPLPKSYMETDDDSNA